MASLIQVWYSNRGGVTKKLAIIEDAKRNRKEIDAIATGFKSIYEQVYKDARHKTNKMRNSIQVTVNEKGGQISVGAYYSRFLEKGWTKNGKKHIYPFFFDNVFAGVAMIWDDVKLLYGVGIR